MPTLNEAKKSYVNFLTGRAQAMSRQKRLTEQLAPRRAAAAEAEEHEAALLENQKATMKSVALGEVPESALVEIDEQVHAAGTARERNVQMLTLVERELEQTAIPPVSDGRRLLDLFCSEFARHLVSHRRPRDFAAARGLLLEAFGAWAFMGGDWETFLLEILPEPLDEEVDAARQAFAPTVEVLEDVAQKEAGL